MIWRWALVFLLATLTMPINAAAQPPPATAAAGQVAGVVRVAGTREPLAYAKVLIVAAPPDVSPGKKPKTQLEPSDVDWILEATTDSEGQFVFESVPGKKVRVVVLADGYDRLERWAAVDAEKLRLFVRPELHRYRTEVVVERHPELPQPEHSLDGQRARTYPGTAGDPVRAAQNLPGVARAPGGLGLMAVRGGDPRQTGLFVDGHPVPRAFHILPVASVVDPSMVQRVHLTPGNADAAYGGFAAGLLEIETKPTGNLNAIHGEAHTDLYDVGATVRAPVGRGGVGFAFRRAYVNQVLNAFGDFLGSGVLVPNYWDYLGRFDFPLTRRHHVTVKAFGAGDALRDGPGRHPALEFQTSFHRFDAGYAFEGPRLRLSASAAVLLEDTRTREQDYETAARRGITPSLRVSLSYRLAKYATLLSGADFVHATAHREFETDDSVEWDVKHWRFGTWVGASFQFAVPTGLVIVRPQIRWNVYGDPAQAQAAADPRLDVRAQVHRRVEVFAAAGVYSAPFVVSRELGLGLIEPKDKPTSHIEVPDWLVAYFDPGAQDETPKGLLLVPKTIHASIGTAVELPGDIELRSTLFWRETLRASATGELMFFDQPVEITVRSPAARAYGLEVFAERKMGKWIHGLLSYTLLRAMTTPQTSLDDVFDNPEADRSSGELAPTPFDQRHNLVALAVLELPHGFRFGLRFRVASGNPETPVIGTKVSQNLEAVFQSTDSDPFGYTPIYGARGVRYGPVFHQLDARLDKVFVLRRATLIAYVDVQNVYNHRYPEIWVHSADWSTRGARVGLPIFPSVGLRAEF